MRALLLILIVAASVNCNFFKSLKPDDIVKSLKSDMKGKMISKVDKLVSRIKQDVNNIPILEEKLNKKTPRTEPVLNEEQKEFLDKQKPFGRKFNGKARRRESSIERINARRGIIDSLFQGDMLLSIDQQNQILWENSVDRFKRQAHNDETYPERKWPKKVSYAFDGNLVDDNAKKAFQKAVELWTNNTCIDFEEDKEEEAEDLLLVYKEHGCWAEVGRQVGLQLISLGEGCNTIGIAAHELGHALGFWHTHSRHDRDQFITILEENIQLERRDQFVAKTTLTNKNYDLPYDYGSLMHYRNSEFINTTAGREGKLTIIPKDIMYTETLGSGFISFYDLLMMNMYYNCTESCKHKLSAESHCKNGGFAHPRNCSKCICPSGYGGQYCNERPPGCGAVLNASDTWKTLEDPLNSTDTGPDDFNRCSFWITAPEDKKVELEIVDVPAAYYKEGCRNAGVEIKLQMDQRRTGYRFCSAIFINTTLLSNSSVVPVITYIHKNLAPMKNRDEDRYTEFEEEGEPGDDSDESEEEEDESKEEDDDEDDSEDEDEHDSGELLLGASISRERVILKYRYI